MQSRRSFRGLFLFVIISFSGAAAASEYIGEFCWHFVRPGDPDSELVILGISLEGDDHYSVNGRVIAVVGSGGQGETTPANGNLEFLDDIIVMTLTRTEREDDPPAGGLFGNTILQARVDPTGGDGTFQAVTNLYDLAAGTFDPPEYDQGLVTFLPDCALP